MIPWVRCVGYHERARDLYTHAMIGYNADGEVVTACGITPIIGRPFWQVARPDEPKRCPICDRDERVMLDRGYRWVIPLHSDGVPGMRAHALPVEENGEILHTLTICKQQAPDDGRWLDLPTHTGIIRYCYECLEITRGAEAWKTQA